MSKNYKGKKGEIKLARTLTKMAEVEDDVDFFRPTFTNAADNGIDFALKAPHNIYEKIKAIIDDNPKIPTLSPTTIKIRIDNKNYSGKISKPVAEKFVSDCKKNEDFGEHWITGGNGLTEGAKKELEDADSLCRYISQEEINEVDNFYTQELENVNDNLNDQKDDNNQRNKK